MRLFAFLGFIVALMWVLLTMIKFSDLVFETILDIYDKWYTKKEIAKIFWNEFLRAPIYIIFQDNYSDTLLQYMDTHRLTIIGKIVFTILYFLCEITVAIYSVVTFIGFIVVLLVRKLLFK